MMILNQVTRVFTLKGRGNTNKSNNDTRRSSANNRRSSNVVLLRSNHIFRRQKTASSIDIPKKVENSKDDPKRTTFVTTSFLSLKQMYTHDTNDIDDDDDDIVSVTSNSTIDLTPSPVLPRRVLTSSQSRKRTDSITIPHVPKLLLPFDNKHDENNNNVDVDDTTTSAIIPVVHLPVGGRFTTHMNDDDNDNSDRYLLETAIAFDLDDSVCSSDDDDESQSYSDCDDSCIFAAPPVQFVSIPSNFSHADAFLLQTTQDSNTKARTVLLNRPPTRIGDWDHHTIESNNNPEDDGVLLDNNTSENCKRSAAAGVATAGTRTTAVTMTSLANQRYQARRRHRARAIVSQHCRPLSSSHHHHHNNNNNNLTLRRTLSTIIIHKEGKQVQHNNNNQQVDQNEDQDQIQRQPRVVKWNMIR